MDLLTIIGGLLFFLGLFIFSIKLIAYNRRKFTSERQSNEQSFYPYRQGHLIMRILALIIFVVALIIFYFFSES